MAMRMAAMHLIRNPHKFYKLIEFQLQKTGESFESYCYNVFHSKIWGDDLIAAVFSDMWNLAITIVSPCFRSRIDLFPTVDQPDIVIIANGGSCMADRNASTHFSSTRCTEEGFRKPGIDLVNSKPGLEPDVVYKRLKPVVLDDVAKAKKLAVDEYMKAEQRNSLELLYIMHKQINRADDEIATLIRMSERMKEQKKKFEFNMEQLGISLEKIRAATIHKELPYMLTEEREREEIRKERKRKFEEEEKEEEIKRRKVVERKHGEGLEGDDDLTQNIEEGGSELEHDKKVISQLQALVKSQEQLMQQQETALIQAQMKVKQLEIEKTTQQQQQQQQQQFPTIPSLSNITDFDDITMETLDQSTVVDLTSLTGVTPIEQQVHVASIPTPTTSTSYRRPGPWALQNLVKPEHMKFFAPVKKEPVQMEQTETIIQIPVQSSGEIPQGVQEGVPQVVQQVVAADASTVYKVLAVPPASKETAVFVTKQDGSKKKVVLVKSAGKRSGKRANPGVSVAQSLRKGEGEGETEKRYYCQNCDCHYSKKEDLTKHVKNMCGKTIPEFICEACDKGFHQEVGVREHYYHEHLKKFLYHCTKCNKGFHFKSRKSNHKRVCPNKDEPDKYHGKIDLDPELEKTFKRRKLVEIDSEKTRSEDSEDETEENPDSAKKDDDPDNKKTDDQDKQLEQKEMEETEQAVAAITPEKKQTTAEETDI